MYIAIDIGGTNTRIASFKSLDKPQVIDKFAWLDSHIKKEDTMHLKLQLKNLGYHFKAIGIAITGDLNKEKTQVNETRWNHEWEKVPIVKLLSDEFDCPVFMDNDAAVAALGVAYFGEGKGIEFTYITWGSGIGGARITLDNGLQISEKLDWFEYFKDWEAKCGGKQIEKTYKKAPENLKKYEWNKIVNFFKIELELFKKKLDSKEIILGGGIAQNQKANLSKISDLKITSLGNDAGLFGALSLIKSSLS